MSVRLKFALSYAGFLMLAGAALLATGLVFLLRYFPDVALSPGGVLSRSLLCEPSSPPVWG